MNLFTVYTPSNGMPFVIVPYKLIPLRYIKCIIVQQFVTQKKSKIKSKVSNTTNV